MGADAAGCRDLDRDNSCASRERAGWRESAQPTGWEELKAARVNPRWSEFSWLAVRSLLDSANDKIAKNIHDLVNARRMRWMAAMRAAGADPELRIEGFDDDTRTLSFLLLGDPGEADPSQYALVGNAARPGEAGVGPLQVKAPDTDFMLLASDVIYPAGDVNDYENAVFLPYWWYDKPILGQPGNHDWYDGLNGFMWHFCGAEPLPPLEFRPGSFTGVERLARQLWRKASRPNRVGLLGWRSKQASSRNYGKWKPPQPGPYFSVECHDLKVLVVDNGITGTIDREQAEWLLRESTGAKRKLLITGKPIYVKNHYEPGKIVWSEEDDVGESDRRPLKTPRRAHPAPRPQYESDYRTVDDIVRDVNRHFVAAIGGDTHNYERYTVRIRPSCKPEALSREHTIEYLVAGGAGAYLSATHTIPPVEMDPDRTEKLPAEVQPIRERRPEGQPSDFRCYPLRGDSVAYYVKPLGRFLYSSGAVALALLVGIAGTYLALSGDSFPEPFEELKLWEAIGIAFGTLVALAALVIAAAQAGKRAPKGYGVFTAVTAAGALLSAGLWAMSRWTWWEDEWVLAPSTIGVLLVVIGIALVGYFTRGSSPRFLGDLAVVLAGAAAITLLRDGWERWDSAARALAAVAVGLAVLVFLVPALGWLRRHPTWGSWYRRGLVAAAITLAVLGVIAAWDEGEVRVAAAAAMVVACVPVLAYVLLLVLSGAWSPMLHADFRDPTRRADAILTLVHTELGLQPNPRHVPDERIDKRSKRLVKVFMSTGWFGRLRVLDGIVSPAADRNQAPFFKQFLHIEVKDEFLTIKCFGVTGWAEDAADPPVEDCVRISLARDDRDAPGARAAR